MLWVKDKYYGTIKQHKNCVMIPDTIFYVNMAPIIWYFTDKNKDIKKKGDGKMNKEHIYKYFMKKPSKSGVCA